MPEQSTEPETLTLELTKSEVNALLTTMMAGAMQLGSTHDINKAVFKMGVQSDTFFSALQTDVSNLYKKVMQGAVAKWPKGMQEQQKSTDVQP